MRFYEILSKFIPLNCNSSAKFFLKLHQVILTIIIDNLHYILFHSVMCIQHVFLRFSSGATRADLLVASMVAEPFLINLFAHVQALN